MLEQNLNLTDFDWVSIFVHDPENFATWYALCTPGALVDNLPVDPKTHQPFVETEIPNVYRKPDGRYVRLYSHFDKDDKETTFFVPVLISNDGMVSVDNTVHRNRAYYH